MSAIAQVDANTTISSRRRVVAGNVLNAGTTLTKASCPRHCARIRGTTVDARKTFAVGTRSLQAMMLPIWHFDGVVTL
jgi:hypothetical protein